MTRYSIVFFLCLLFLGCSIKQSFLNQLHFNKDEKIESSNLYNIDKMFGQINRGGKSDEDYYFIVIGDTRNLIRSYSLAPFDRIVKHIFFLKDKTTGEPIYNKIKFMIHLGDMVYNGAEKAQWLNLKRAFSNKEFARDNYSFLKIFTASKPIFPALGNHEILRFDIRFPASGKGFDKSKRGVRHFKDFFNWNGFIASPNIMTPIPAEFSRKGFEVLLKRAAGEKERDILRKHYRLAADNRYRLRIFLRLIRDFKGKKTLPGLLPELLLDPVKKKTVCDELQAVFRGMGYNTVPVLSSDNMICYAFETGDLVFLVLDSMARGMHYHVFNKLKRALFGKTGRHRLHLFSKSDLNGQYGFFRAVFQYAASRGKTLVPLWHHSPFNGHTILDGIGVGYNLKRMLGLTSRKQNPSDTGDSGRTFLDDIIFPRRDGAGKHPAIHHVFTSCVHTFESFQLKAMRGKQRLNLIRWYNTGGGGAELSKKFHYHRIENTVKMYNQRLAVSASTPGHIEMTGHLVNRNYHFLVVRVKDGRIADVYPHFVKKNKVNVRPAPFFKNFRFTSIGFTGSQGIGTMMGLDLVRLGFEKASRYLYFITWEPGLETGLFTYDYHGKPKTTGMFSFSPLRFSLNIPRHRYTLTLFRYTKLFAPAGGNREFVSLGVESPVFHNIFGTAKRWSLSADWYFPLNRGDRRELDFAGDLKFSFGVSYRF